MPICNNTLLAIGAYVKNNPNDYKLSQTTLNIIQRHKLTTRTWKEKKAKIQHRQKKRRQNKARTTHLPTIANANTRSIRNKLETLNQFLDDTDIDLLFLTETWLNQSNKNVTQAQISNKYHIISNERTTKKGGGTMIAINSSYATDIKQINCKIENSDTEITLGKLRPKRLPRGYSNCYVASIYIPPKAASKNNTTKYNEVEAEEIAKTITTIIDEDSSTNQNLIIICGDFNGAKSDTLCRQLQIKQLNTIPTRKNKLLDPIFTNEPNSKLYKCTNKNIFNSDHDLVLAKPIFKLHKQRQPKKESITTRTGKLEDTISEIGKIDWKELIDTETDPQSKFDVFYNTIDDIQNTCQPTKIIKIRDDKEWMTPKIKLLIKQRQKSYRQNKVDEWRRLANSVRYNIRRRKENYYSQFKNNDSKK